MRVTTKARAIDQEGIWAKFPGTDAEFLIARAGNSVFLAAVDKFERPFRRQRQRGGVSSEVEIEIQCKSMAEGILLNWKGLKDEDGNVLEYSKELAFAVLRHNSDVREFVTEIATDQNNFRQEEIDSVAKK